LGKFRCIEHVDIGDIPDQARLYQLRHHHFAKTLDVHRAARSEMLDSPPHLGRALRIDAAHRHLRRILHHRAAAFWTFYRHPKFLFRSGAQILPHVHHRGNDFARFLDDNGIADANVFACDLFFVVQSRAAYG
jgi:hypothetical protein